MKKIAIFLTDHRFIIAIIMLVLTVVCAVLTAFVPINKDRTKYLADDSNMKQGIAIMNSDFPETEEKASIRVMFDDLTEEEMTDVLERLKAIPYVSSVVFDPDSEDHKQGEHTLFIVNSRFDYTTDEEKTIEAAIKNGFPDHTMVFRNNDIQETKVPLWLLLVAVALMIVILLVMCNSWLEPALFLITIGIAILINMGTNIVFPYIDEMTASIGPVIQLVLSMDYSIILMNRYLQEKERHADRRDAMKAALAGSVSSIAASSFTTAAGLLALVFLSFKLGPELGIILAKGVVISMVCVLTILPVLILLCDKWLEKTKKRSLHVPMGFFAAFSRKTRYAMPAIFIILFVGFLILQSFTQVSFLERSEDPLEGIFPKENTVVLLYRSAEEEQIDEVIDGLEDDEKVTSIIGYRNTLGKPCDAAQMSDMLNSMLKTMQQDTDAVIDTVTDTITDTVIEAETDRKADDGVEAGGRAGADDGVEAGGRAGADNGVGADDGVEAGGRAGVDDGVEAGGRVGADSRAGVDDGVEAGGRAGVDDGVEAGGRVGAGGRAGADDGVEVVTAARTGSGWKIDDSMIRMLYLYYQLQHGKNEMSLVQLFDYICDELMEDPQLSGYFDEETKGYILSMREELDSAIIQMKGPDYSRLVITSDYAEESPETAEFIARIKELCDVALDEHYLIGTSVMVSEMNATFEKEYLLITLITAIAIFLVVLIAFHRPVIPLILTLLVQCGVFITVTVIGAYTGSIYYLALLIVQSILMGATIDYGIVFCNFYKESRKKLDMAASLKNAYEKSIHTIMTSGTILVLVLAALGLFAPSAMIVEVSITLSIGAMVAIFLILFVLPGTIACCDRFIVKQHTDP